MNLVRPLLLTTDTANRGTGTCWAQRGQHEWWQGKRQQVTPRLPLQWEKEGVQKDICGPDKKDTRKKENHAGPQWEKP